MIFYENKIIAKISSNYSKLINILPLRVQPYSNNLFSNPLYKIKNNLFRRRLSQSTSNKNKGSITLESALVIPIVVLGLLGILNLSKYFIAVESVNKNLHETARQLARTCQTQEDLEKCDLSLANDCFGKLFCNENSDNCIQNIRVSKTDVDSRNNDICIQVSGQYNVFIPLVGNIKFPIKGSVKEKAYTGLNSVEISQNEIYVYITENQSVYHTRLNCSHLQLSIKAISKGEFYSRYANKYNLCRKCRKIKCKEDKIYITQYGNKYHFSINCSGLKRTIKKVKLSEVGEKRKCKRCEEKDNN